MRASFHVEIAQAAESDLRAMHDFIAQDKPAAAAKWLNGMLRAARSLRSLPFRHEVIPEAEELGVEYRQMVRGNYRIIYRVEGRQVVLVRVVHAARRLTSHMLHDEPP